MLKRSALGLVSESWNYNAFAEPIGHAATFDGNALYATSYTRDKLGRITQQLETVNGTLASFDYSYDLAGRLAAVAVNGVQTAGYSYDSNGNRVAVTQSGAGIPAQGCAAGVSALGATVDAQDRQHTSQLSGNSARLGTRVMREFGRTTTGTATKLSSRSIGS